MALLNIWTVKTGTLLGTYEETIAFEIPISSLTTTTTGVSYRIIAGTLPPGVSLSNTKISGIPAEVSASTIYRFCIRATKGNDFADRTFLIKINGYDVPYYTTNAGLLDIGPGGQLFVIDGTYISYQLMVEDTDIQAGQVLRFSLKEGLLPPGLYLTSTGIITGVVQPIVQTKVITDDGTYDYNYYDTDFYDYGETSEYTRKLNRYYEFVVNVSDGGSIITRTFKIFVIGDDYFRADVTRWTADTTEYTSDVSWLIPPEWKTPSFLGTYRADNKLILKLDTYSTTLVKYEQEVINADILATIIAGTVADNKYGKRSITFTAPVSPIVGHYLSFAKEFGKIQWCEFTLYQKGMVILYGIVPYVCKSTHISSKSFETDLSAILWGVFNSHKTYSIATISTLGPHSYRAVLTSPLEIDVPEDIDFYIGTLCTYPPNMVFDTTNGEIYCDIPAQSETKKAYRFTITAIREYLTDWVSSARVFTLEMLGNITQRVTWSTESTLRELGAGYLSDINLEAVASEPDTQLLYTLMDGEMPPGLTLSTSGELVGSVVEYGGIIDQPTTFNNGTTNFDNGTTLIDASYEVSYNESGLIAFDSMGEQENTTFDSVDTSFDREYTFTVRATDAVRNVATDQTFTINTNTDATATSYSNIRVQPYLPVEQRTMWNTFITNNSVFTPTKLFRVADLAFGVQRDLNMLIYPGVETVAAEKYVSAMGTNNKRKRFMFGELTKAVARYPGTTQTLYEVVYVKMIDPLEPSAQVLPDTVAMIKDPHLITTDISNSIWDLPPPNIEYLDSNFIVDINTTLLTHNNFIQIDVYANSPSGFGVTELRWGTRKMYNNLSGDYFTNSALSGTIPIQNNTAQLIRRLTDEFDCTLHKHFAIELYIDTNGNSTLIYRSPTITIDEEGVLSSFSRRPRLNITADSTSYLASDINIIQRHPSSISIWRNNITEWNNSILKTDRNYIPLWMRTVQPAARDELGFIPAVVLCYCVPGMADDIIANIRHYITTTGFSFNQLDFVIDRYIINAVKTVAGTIKQDKYLMFRNDRGTL
jgi:hypothetical protein